jgi:hypothetical protein
MIGHFNLRTAKFSTYQSPHPTMFHVIEEPSMLSNALENILEQIVKMTFPNQSRIVPLVTTICIQTPLSHPFQQLIKDIDIETPPRYPP